MLVRELEEILSTIKDKNLKIVMNGYYTYEVNGYYFDKKDDDAVLVLTNNNVKPRIVTEYEV